MSGSSNTLASVNPVIKSSGSCIALNLPCESLTALRYILFVLLSSASRHVINQKTVRLLLQHSRGHQALAATKHHLQAPRQIHHEGRMLRKQV
jgi:hypothetical protein